MNLHTVLFEDPTVTGLAPLAASVPQFEVRCGLFNLRERLEVLGVRGGSLRLRAHLAPLATDRAWTVGTEAPGESRSLWLAGRLAPSCALAAGLVAAAQAGEFVLRDARGALAAALDGPAAAAWETAWREMADGPWAADAAPWRPPVPAGWALRAEGAGGELLAPAEVAGAVDLVAEPPLDWIWQVVSGTRAALTGDLEFCRGEMPGRRPWGVVPAGDAAPWQSSARLEPLSDLPAGVYADAPERVFAGPDAVCAPGVVMDTAAGPIVIDRGVRVGPHTLLEGPLYLGPGTRVKAGTRLYGESSFGIGCRVAGEIGESTFGDFTNKQHDGFVGHAVLGSWINLGAMTTNSDLKNNYGPVRVDLGDGPRDTGERFVGLLAGDHVKTAIGTLFNTGTVVGFASNIFGGGMPPKHVGAFSWGGGAGAPAYDVERAMATARVVMARRDCDFTPAHETLFRHLAAGN